MTKICDEISYSVSLDIFASQCVSHTRCYCTASKICDAARVSAATIKRRIWVTFDVFLARERPGLGLDQEEAQQRQREVRNRKKKNKRKNKKLNTGDSDDKIVKPALTLIIQKDDSSVARAI